MTSIRFSLATAGLLLLGACQSGVTQSGATLAQCAAPLTGSRYAICGRLSTNGTKPSAGAVQLSGNLNAGSGTATSAKYQVVGGTFHASY